MYVRDFGWDATLVPDEVGWWKEVCYSWRGLAFQMSIDEVELAGPGRSQT
jgi:hypothetical protein